MLKNSIVLIFLSLLNIALYAQSEVLTIYKKNGTSEQHLFIDHPKIYHHGDNLLMKTDNVIVSYPFDSISKYTVNESNETLILKRITIDNDKLQEYINENDIDDCDITYIRTFEEYDGDGIMAVTDYIDDEKPLYIATDEKLEITAFCDVPTPETHYISGGIYGLSPKALDILEQCMADGTHRMRNFQRRLVESGMKLKAFPLGKIIDIDHAEDIRKAELFIAEK